MMKTLRIGKMNSNGQRGAAVVEFAIVLLPLVLILFGTIEFGLFVYNKQVITNASREGARAGIVLRSPKLAATEIEAIATNYCNGNLVTFGGSTAPSCNATGAQGPSQSDLTVNVGYNYTFLVLSSFGFGPRSITATSVMRHE